MDKKKYARFMLFIYNIQNVDKACSESAFKLFSNPLGRGVDRLNL